MQKDHNYGNIAGFSTVPLTILQDSKDDFLINAQICWVLHYSYNKSVGAPDIFFSHR